MRQGNAVISFLNILLLNSYRIFAIGSILLNFLDFRKFIHTDLSFRSIGRPASDTTAICKIISNYISSGISTGQIQPGAVSNCQLRICPTCQRRSSTGSYTCSINDQQRPSGKSCFIAIRCRSIFIPVNVRAAAGSQLLGSVNIQSRTYALLTPGQPCFTKSCFRFCRIVCAQAQNRVPSYCHQAIDTVINKGQSCLRSLSDRIIALPHRIKHHGSTM